MCSQELAEQMPHVPNEQKPNQKLPETRAVRCSPGGPVALAQLLHDGGRGGFGCCRSLESQIFLLCTPSNVSRDCIWPSRAPTLFKNILLFRRLMPSLHDPPAWLAFSVRCLPDAAYLGSGFANIFGLHMYSASLLPSMIRFR